MSTKFDYGDKVKYSPLKNKNNYKPYLVYNCVVVGKTYIGPTIVRYIIYIPGKVNSGVDAYDEELKLRFKKI